MDNKVVQKPGRGGGMGDVVLAHSVLFKIHSAGERREGLEIWPSFFENIHNQVNYSSQTFVLLYSFCISSFAHSSTQAQLVIHMYVMVLSLKSNLL